MKLLGQLITISTYLIFLNKQKALRFKCFTEKCIFPYFPIIVCQQKKSKYECDKKVMRVNIILRNLQFTWNNSIELNKLVAHCGTGEKLCAERGGDKILHAHWFSEDSGVSLLWILSIKLTWLYIDWKWLYIYLQISVL